MPISGPSSYGPMADEILAHWALVNATFAGSGSPPSGGWPEMVLKDGRNRAALLALRTSLSNTILPDVELKANVREIARADIAIKRQGLHDRAGQFAAAVRSGFAGTAVAGALANLPPLTAKAADFEQVMNDFATHWTLVNASTPPAGVSVPVTLAPLSVTTTPVPPPYTQGNFAAELTALRTAHTALPTAQAAFSAALGNRNSLHEQMHEFFALYREAVESKLAMDHPLILTIPRLSPLPGSTPEPASISGLWNAALGKVVITFTPSPSASVVRHELRYVAGPEYDADLETIAASLNVGAGTEFQTLLGVPSPGTTGSYRVYAITAEGNERTSNTVVVVRV